MNCKWINKFGDTWVCTHCEATSYSPEGVPRFCAAAELLG